MFLAFKEIRQSKLRYTLISVITIAVLFLVFFVTGLANGLAFGDSSSIRNIQADYIVMNKEADGAIIKSDLTPKDVEIISEQLGRNGYTVSDYHVSFRKKYRKRCRYRIFFR